MKNDKLIYKGPIFTLHQFDVEINNKTYKRDVLDHCEAVGVVVEKDNKYLLIKQFRYGIGKDTLEIPAGLIDEGETPLDAARRELQEEAGFDAEVFEKFYYLYPVPAYCNEAVHLFLAKNLTSSSLPCDEDEDLEKVWMTKEEIIAELNNVNTVFDMKTVIAFLYLFR